MQLSCPGSPGSYDSHFPCRGCRFPDLQLRRLRLLVPGGELVSAPPQKLPARVADGAYDALVVGGARVRTWDVRQGKPDGGRIRLLGKWLALLTAPFACGIGAAGCGHSGPTQNDRIPANRGHAPVDLGKSLALRPGGLIVSHGGVPKIHSGKCTVVRLRYRIPSRSHRFWRSRRRKVQRACGANGVRRHTSPGEVGNPDCSRTRWSGRSIPTWDPFWDCTGSNRICGMERAGSGRHCTYRPGTGDPVLSGPDNSDAPD